MRSALVLSLLLLVPAAARADEPASAPNLVRPGCPPDSIEERCQVRPSTARITFDPGIAVFAQYNLQIRKQDDSTSWFHEFDLTRAHAWLGVTYGDAHARVLVEAVRSASEGALLGVGGDSLVFRVREAYAGYLLFQHLDIRGGVVPTLTIPVIERSWGMRPVNPSGLERAGFASPADLGATIVGTLPKGFGWIGVGAYNGDGYNEPELNRGKNVEIAAEIHPIAVVEPARPLTVFGSYTSGSSGTGLARADRVNAGLAWQGGIVRGGVAFGYAFGVGDQGQQNAFLIDTFAKATLFDHLLLGADLTYWKRDVSVAADDAVLFTGTAGAKIVDPLSTFLAFDGQFLGTAARTSLPDLPDYQLRVIASFEFDHVFSVDVGKKPPPNPN